MTQPANQKRGKATGDETHAHHHSSNRGAGFGANHIVNGRKFVRVKHSAAEAKKCEGDKYHNPIRRRAQKIDEWHTAGKACKEN